jgi:hypothetical protein
MLDWLMSRAIADQREEAAFFRALLRAKVYAHIPMGDRIDARSGRVRFIQFPRPDSGQLVLPFFSDEAKARFAAQSAVQIIAMNARQFFELTRGATLMLNPNDAHCVLYPEEVDALLKTGRIATIQKFTVERATAPTIGTPQEIPSWLIETLTAALDKLPFVDVAYMAGVYRDVEAPQQIGIVIALGGAPTHAERAVHAAITALQPVCDLHSKYSVDITHFDSSSAPPNWITALHLEPLYDRRWCIREGAPTKTSDPC